MNNIKHLQLHNYSYTNRNIVPAECANIMREYIQRHYDLPLARNRQSCECHQKGLFCDTEDCMYRADGVDCPNSCLNRGRCRNKRFTTRDFRNVRIKGTGDRMEMGLYADENVGWGDFMAEFMGEVTTEQPPDGDNYAISFAPGTNLNLLIMQTGNEARYVNHHCDPNCTVWNWVVHDRLHLVLVAIEDIAAGEQLFFDYGWRYEDGETPTPCICGGPSCTGIIGRPADPNEPGRRVRRSFSPPRPGVPPIQGPQPPPPANPAPRGGSGGRRGRRGGRQGRGGGRQGRGGGRQGRGGCNSGGSRSGPVTRSQTRSGTSTSTTSSGTSSSSTRGGSSRRAGPTSSENRRGSSHFAGPSTSADCSGSSRVAKPSSSAAHEGGTSSPTPGTSDSSSSHSGPVNYPVINQPNTSPEETPSTSGEEDEHIPNKATL